MISKPAIASGRQRGSRVSLRPRSGKQQDTIPSAMLMIFGGIVEKRTIHLTFRFIGGQP
jgi:hypothetical protein